MFYLSEPFLISVAWLMILLVLTFSIFMRIPLTENFHYARMELSPANYVTHVKIMIRMGIVISVLNTMCIYTSIILLILLI